MMHSVTRYHDISTGHRVAGHESKCAHLHGHNYRIHFTCIAELGLDGVGRVIDFSQIKSRLCEWVEQFWDHKFLLWDMDEEYLPLVALYPQSVVLVPFNPTAENMAEYLVDYIGPHMLRGSGVRLAKVQIDETRKCSASYVARDLLP